jgi:hypothetical protein
MGSKRKSALRRMCAAALALLGVVFVTGTASAQTGWIGILGGGPVYKHNPTNIHELKKAGFNELIVWSVEVGATGDLNLNAEFPLTSGGKYIGDQTWPEFAHDLRTIKSGKVARITFSIGSSNIGDFQHIKALIDSQGTGRKSILYKDFRALAQALPVDAIDLDDENSYDSESTTKFALMLGGLGYHVTIDPYTNNSYWTSLVSGINSQMPGLVDGVHLQTYAGGAGNNPCVNWDFGDVPVFPGLSDDHHAPPFVTPDQAKAKLEGWHTQCAITGAWLWIFDQIAGTTLPKQYAHAMIQGVGGARE